MMNNTMMSPADFAAVTGNNNNGFMNGDGWGWLVIILLFAIGGWGNNGWGGFGGGSNGAAENYVLASDFATLQRQIDSGISSLERKGDTINAGLCDGFYAMNSSLLNGFGNVNTAIMQQGYENRIGQNDIANQLATCCCTTQQNIKDVQTQSVMNTSAIQQQIQQCCCDNEKLTMQAAFDAQRYNCDTLSAIDKLGDRIIGYMDNAENNRMRDELATYRLAASQQAQNAYLVDKLGFKQPVPAFQVPNPFAPYYGGYGFGTTIA